MQGSWSTKINSRRPPEPHANILEGASTIRGIAVHWISTLWATLPSSSSCKFPSDFISDRAREQSGYNLICIKHAKFPAYYSWKRSPSKSMFDKLNCLLQRKLGSAGAVRYTGSGFGHKRTDISIRNFWRSICSTPRYRKGSRCFDLEQSTRRSCCDSCHMVSAARPTRSARRPEQNHSPRLEASSSLVS